MRTGGPDPDAPPVAAKTATTQRWWWIGLAAVVLGGLALRLWGIHWGLPFAYNLDERSHFVPRAVAYFSQSSLDPDYQLNPSGLIEWIAGALFLVHWSSGGITRAWANDPGSVWAVARVASALLSTAGIALLYAAGARLFDRRVGLLAAAILATAFLPVHYGHLALNDGPSLAPTGLALFAIAGIVRFGRKRDYLLAGVAVGIAVGFKYNAAFIVLPLLTAAAIHAVGWRPGDLRPPADARRTGDGLLPAWRAVLIGLVVAAVGGAVAFFVCDPYAVLRPGFFRSEVQHLSDYTAGGLLLGETQRSGYRYYLWSLLWGFGALPLVLTVVGGVRLLIRDRWQALVLLPAPLIFLVVIGGQGRYFARYGMPIYPILAILAAAGGVWAGAWLLSRLRVKRDLRIALALTAGIVVVAQGVVFAVHNDAVLAREDTRTTARDWMVANIPARTTIVVEPIVPREWYADSASLPSKYSRKGYRWERLTRTGEEKRALIRKYPKLRSNIRKTADFANYGFTRFPGMLDFYRQKGACWIVSGSHQSGRAFNNPGRVPEAIKYYRALERESDLRFEINPFSGPKAKNYFQYDLAFDFAPLRYTRPGPSVRIYRLRDCTPKVVPEQR